MSKSFLAYFLSFAIGLQPLTLYPIHAFAESITTTTPTIPQVKIPQPQTAKTPAQPDKEEGPAELLEIIKKTITLKSKYVRNKIYGKTPGADPSQIPSHADILAVDQELQNFKPKLFANIRGTLSDPGVLPRDEKKVPSEWIDLLLFYSAAAEIENLKSLAGLMPSEWDAKYSFEIPIDKIYLTAFIQNLGVYNRSLNIGKAHRWPFMVQLYNKNIGEGIYKFRLNPLLATGMAEEAFASIVNKEQMLKLAQMVAAEKLYESLTIAMTLNRQDASPYPEISPALKEKFPLLEWKRRDNIEIGRFIDQRSMMTELADKKVGALVQKLNKESRFLINSETMIALLKAADPERAEPFTDEEIKEFVEAHLNDEKGLPMIQTLQSILYSTAFNPQHSIEYWRQNIKVAIAQAKVAVAEDMMLSVPGRTELARDNIRKVFRKRALEFITIDMENFDVNAVLKYIKSPQALYAETRYEFQKNLWLSAQQMENELAIENSPVDLSVVVDPEFIKLLNASINKVVREYDIKIAPGSPAAYKVTKTLSQDIQPVTVAWLQQTFQPDKSYAELRALYKMLIFAAMADFEMHDAFGKPTGISKEQLEPTTRYDAFGKRLGPSPEILKRWIMAATYKNNSVLLDNDPANFLAIDLQNKAPATRKQELIELIKIGENLGFFSDPQIDDPKVRDLNWGPEWKKAYQAVKRKRIIAQNPILAMRMDDTEKESAWASVAFWAPRLVGYYKDGKNLAEELAPLYSKGTEQADARADALVSSYLSKLQDLIQKNLEYVANVESVEQRAVWNSPTTWKNAFFDNPKPEFSEEFKKVVAYSSILAAKLNEHARYQPLFQRMVDEFAQGDAYGKAYDKLFQFYVIHIGYALLGFSVMKGIARYGKNLSSPKAITTYERLKAFETDALVPIFGPSLRYYTFSSMAWLAAEAYGNGYDTFDLQRGLRNRFSDLALSSAIGPGLIDMKTKVTVGDGGYDSAHFHYWTSDGLLLIMLGGAGVYFAGRGLYNMASRLSSSSKANVWKQSVRQWMDDIGYQTKDGDGNTIFHALNGDLEANAIATKLEVAERFARSKKLRLNNPDAISNWLQLEYFNQHVEHSKQALIRTFDALTTEWAGYGHKFANHFKNIKLEPGQWDIQLLMQRKKDIETAFFKDKKISREQYWVLKHNVTELMQFLNKYLDTFKGDPAVKKAITERLATTASQLEFDEVGRLIRINPKAVPQAWKQVTNAHMKEFNEAADQALLELLHSRELNMSLRFGRNYKNIPHVERIQPREGYYYNLLPRRPILEELAKTAGSLQ